MAELLRGAPVAAALNERTAACAAALKESGVIPTLAILRVEFLLSHKGIGNG